jgi:hypothetical protein
MKNKLAGKCAPKSVTRYSTVDANKLQVLTDWLYNTLRALRPMQNFKSTGSWGQVFGFELFKRLA